MQYQLFPHIVADPGILSGRPVVEGTQVPASMLIEQVAEGKSLDRVAQENGVGIEDVRAALEYGAQRVDEDQVLSGATTADAGQSNESAEDVNTSAADQHTPATQLGARLAEIRARIAASGTSMRTWDELDAEMDEMRRRELDAR